MIGSRTGARPTAQEKAADPKPMHTGGERTEPADGTVQSLKRELAQLNDAVAHNVRELAALIGGGSERHMVHAAGKLGAAVEGMERRPRRF